MGLKMCFLNYVNELWTDIVFNISNGSKICSSEKSLVFEFAWKLKKKYGDEIELDFEKPIFKNFSGGKFLDLYVVMKKSPGQQIRYGFEFKYPKTNSKGNSNRTQTRIKIVNDIKRLTHLVTKNKDKIDTGIFLLATDERCYTKSGKRNIAPDFIVHNNAFYKKNMLFPIHDPKSTEQVISIADITFKWQEKEGNIKMHFIEPIIISY